MANILVGCLMTAHWFVGASGITAVEWTTAINIAGRQRMLSQRMSKEFLLVAKGINVSDTTATLASTMNLFHTSLNDLKTGSSANSIPAPPNANITTQLNAVSSLWMTFKGLLESSLNSTQISNNALTSVAQQNLPLLTESNEAVSLYVAAAAAAGASIPGAVVDISGRQRMLSQRMAKEALLLSLGIDAATNRQKLTSSIALFSASHTNLLQGAASLGLSQTTNACILQQMLVVKGLWDQFRQHVAPVAAGTASATHSMAEQVALLSPTLLSQMNAAVTLYAASSPSCTPAVIPGASWTAAINMAGRQRMLSQKMSKEFLLVAKGINTTSNRAALASTIALFAGSLTKLLEGDIASSIPAAPTQAIANQLIVVQGLWNTFKTLLESNAGKASIPSSVLTDVAQQSLPLLTQANAAVTLYVNAAQSAGANAPGAVVNKAGRQRMLSQKMAKEALLIALGVDASSNQANLQATVNEFDTAHNVLLNGDSSASIPATTETCILQQMSVVTSTWSQLKPSYTAVLNSDTSTGTLTQIADRNPTLLTEMNAAVTMYAAPSSSCTTSTTTAKAVAKISGAHHAAVQPWLLFAPCASLVASMMRQTL